MNKKNESLTSLMLKYDMEAVAKKMLKEVAKATPEEIGRTILRSKRHRQLIINLEAKN